MFSITLTALVATAALVTPADRPDPGRPATRLTLTVSDSRGHTTSAELRCAPTGGSHPEAEAACAALSLVAGDFAALDADLAIACTLQYDPVLATARGRWNGREVRFASTFPNGCALTAETGPVFALAAADPV